MIELLSFVLKSKENFFGTIIFIVSVTVCLCIMLAEIREFFNTKK